MTALPETASIPDAAHVAGSAAAVYHQKVALRLESNQGVMPDAPGVIDTLTGLGQKAANGVWRGRGAGGGDHHQIGLH